MASSTSDDSSHGYVGLNDSRQKEDTLKVLNVLRDSYKKAKQQIEELQRTITAGEALVDQHIKYTLQTSVGYRPLCLASLSGGSVISEMGRVVLQTTHPYVIPKTKIQLEINCFGSFDVSSEQGRIEHWQSKKGKAIFEYLVTRAGQPVAREILMEKLWPGYTVTAAGNNLKAAIHSLRQTLSGLFGDRRDFPFIIFSQGSYTINSEIEVRLDVEEFNKHWSLARKLEREKSIAEAVAEYESAEALYTSDYLNDEPYEEWTLFYREELKDTYAIILGKLAEYFMDKNDYESCIVYCQKLLAKDSCCEDAYRRLMTCYDRRGERNRALRWYEICCEAMQKDLDTEPDKETTALYQKLVRNEPL